MDFQVKKFFKRKISALSEDWGGIRGSRGYPKILWAVPF